MRVAVTGTPGTGKSTAVERAVVDLPVVHLNDLVREEGLTEGRDEQRDSLVVDLDAVRDRLAGHEDLLMESHLAHHLDVDRVVVLRCNPDELRERLRERGEPDAKVRENAGTASPSRALADKIRENADSEALDVVLSEAVRRHGVDSVYEIDTTGRSPDAVARDVEAVVAGEREPGQGLVDFTDTLDP